MDRIWLKHYPASVPADIDPSRFPSLKAMLDDVFAQHGPQPAYTCMGRTISYAELDRLSRDFGAWLQHDCGLRPGDRIALMMPNVLQYPIALFGALRAGLTVVNTNPLYTARELEHQLNDAGVRVIVLFEQACHVLQQVLASTRLEKIVVTGIGDQLGFPKAQIVNFVIRRVKKLVTPWQLPSHVTFNAALAAGRRHTLTPVSPTHQDIAFLQYTGGTTGVSKGAMLTQRNMIANVLQASAWLTAFGGGANPKIVGALPMYHIFGLTAVSLMWALEGGHIVLITNPRDIPNFIAELAKHRFNIIYGVNTLYNALLHAPGFERIDWSGLRGSIGGGMAVQGAVAKHWKERTGNVLSQGWGLTETAPVACMSLPGMDFNGAIGLPVSSTEVTIRDDAGNDLGVGEVGEICVRGPQVMAGYWNRPDETAKVMCPDGYLRTGDIGRIDDRGFVYIEDRKKDMILVSGFNVYPNEVEGVVVKMPGILEAAAVSQPDEHSGEVVALFVVRKDPSITAEQVIEFCRTELTGYKVPKHVYFRDDLPKTNVGKILRRALRDELVKSG